VRLGWRLVAPLASWLALAGVGCAESPAPAPAEVPDPRTGLAEAARARRVADWQRLSRALAKLPCKATGKSGGERTSIALPADCLFAAQASVLSDPSGTVLQVIARELAQATERDFWITARPAAGAAGGARLANARAAAVVAALIAQGVPPARVAAIVGEGDQDEDPAAGETEPRPDVATVEIIVAPDRDELAASRGSAR